MNTVMPKIAPGEIASILLMTWALLGLGEPAEAQPSISSVSGVAEQGQQLRIVGSGFGSKASAGPLVYDDFESGTDGQLIAGNPPAVRNISGNWTWSDYANKASNRPRYSRVVTRPNSSLSANMSYGSGAYNNSLEIIRNIQESGGEVYFSFWRYHRKTSTAWSRNVKPWIVYGSTGYHPVAYDGWGSPSQGDGGFRNSVQDAGSTGSTLWGGPNLSSIDGQWIRIEGYLKQSSPGGNDGAFQIWIHTDSSPNISLVQSSTSYTTRSSNNYWRQWHFGSYHATDDPSTASAEVYLDSLYFDTSRARIEIGNSPTWSGSSRREVQIAKSWSSGSIDFELGLGAFQPGQTAYVFVVDANGQASSQGFPITIGGSVAPPPPAADPEPPNNVEVQ